MACLEKARIASSLSMPIPSSITLISRTPLSINSIFIIEALASIEFSTNSLTTFIVFSTTSPAAILLAKSSSITLILLITSPDDIVTKKQRKLK